MGFNLALYKLLTNKRIIMKVANAPDKRPAIAYEYRAAIELLLRLMRLGRRSRREVGI